MPPDEEQPTIEPPTIEPPLFAFNGFYIDRLLFENVERVPPSEGETRPKGIPENVQISGGININHETGRAEMKMVVEVAPDPKWKPYQLTVSIVGRFSRLGATPEQFDEFLRKGAASILFPYVREIIHRTTADGRYGVVRLNPLNLQNLNWDPGTQDRVPEATGSIAP